MKFLILVMGFQLLCHPVRAVVGENGEICEQPVVSAAVPARHTFWRVHALPETLEELEALSSYTENTFPEYLDTTRHYDSARVFLNNFEEDVSSLQCSLRECEVKMVYAQLWHFREFLKTKLARERYLSRSFSEDEGPRRAEKCYDMALKGIKQFLILIYPDPIE